MRRSELRPNPSSLSPEQLARNSSLLLRTSEGAEVMATEFERLVRFEPGYDRRNSDPSKNYGVHGVTVRWVLKRDGKAIQFMVYTDWLPRNVQEEKLRNHIGTHIGIQPMAADIGYHSPAPTYDGQELMDENCEFTNGPCYYDGSGLNAEPIRDRLLTEGDAAVWEEMEKWWQQVFGEAVEAK